MDINKEIQELIEKHNTKKSSAKKGNPVQRIKEHINKSPEQIRSNRFREAVSVVNQEYTFFELSEIGDAKYISLYVDPRANVEFFCTLEDHGPKEDVVCRIMLPLVGTEEQIDGIRNGSLFSNHSAYGNKSDMKDVTFWGIHLTLTKSIAIDDFCNDPAEFVGGCVLNATKLYISFDLTMEKDEYFTLFVLHRCHCIQEDEAGFYSTFVDWLLPELSDSTFSKPQYVYYRHFKPCTTDKTSNVDMLIYSICRDRLLNAILELSDYYCDEGNEAVLEELQKLAPGIEKLDMAAALELYHMVVLPDDRDSLYEGEVRTLSKRHLFH